MSAEIEATDRYGGEQNWPDPATVCEGQCEGMGVFPAYSPKHDQTLGTLGAVITGMDDTALIEASGKTPSADGWVFLLCPDCGGTGRKP